MLSRELGIYKNCPILSNYLIIELSHNHINKKGHSMKNGPLSNKVIDNRAQEGKMACKYLMLQPDAKLGVYYMQSNTTLWVIFAVEICCIEEKTTRNVRTTNGQRTCWSLQPGYLHVTFRIYDIRVYVLFPGLWINWRQSLCTTFPWPVIQEFLFPGSIKP